MAFLCPFRRLCECPPLSLSSPCFWRLRAILFPRVDVVEHSIRSWEQYPRDGREVVLYTSGWLSQEFADTGTMKRLPAASQRQSGLESSSNRPYMFIGLGSQVQDASNRPYFYVFFGSQVQDARFRLDDAMRVQAAAVPEGLRDHLVVIGAHPRLQYYVVAMRRQRPDVAIVVVTSDKVIGFLLFVHGYDFA